jgi:hypothetical protein
MPPFVPPTAPVDAGTAAGRTTNRHKRPPVPSRAGVRRFVPF